MLRNLVSALLICCSFLASGQMLFGLKGISSVQDDYARCLTRDAKGNTFLGLNLNSYANHWIYGIEYTPNQVGNLIKINSSGAVAWMMYPYQNINDLEIGLDGFLYATRDGVTSKIDPETGAVLLDIFQYDSRQVLADKSGNVYLSGTTFLLKFSPNGDLAWRIDFNPHLNGLNNPLINFDPEGNIVLAGEFSEAVAFGDFLIENVAFGNSLYVVTISPQGNVIDAKSFGDGVGHLNIRDLKVDLDGTMYMTGRLAGTTQFDASNKVTARGSGDLFLSKLDSDGAVQWLRVAGTSGEDAGSEIVIGDEYLFTTGTFSGNVRLDNALIGFILAPSSVVARFEKKTGKANWIKPVAIIPYDPYNNNVNPVSLEKVDARNLLLSGSFTGNLYIQGDSLVSKATDSFVVNIADTTVARAAVTFVKGKVFNSSKSNCDATQPGMPNIVLKAEPGSFYTMTNADGEYKLNLDPGNYTISQILPVRRSMNITEVCENTNVVQIIPDQTPPVVNFGNETVLTPYLQVDVATDRFRRCFTNDIVVNYCNDGLLEASNVEVKVKFPEHVIPLFSSIPWTEKNNGTLTFKVGKLLPGVCGIITIRDSVRCGDESIRGMTQCVTAQITPENPVQPDPKWDRAGIAVDSKCLDNGFLRLVIRNAGSGTMSDSSVFKIYADDRLAYEKKFRLKPSDSLALQIPANGKTIRLEAYNTPFSPTSMVSVTVEGCGLGSAQVSHGFVNAFPQSDEEEEVEIFCGEILDSYDPNDKQVFPGGITDGHNITGNEEMEYLIRFQNTGTDVAYNIVIKDQLTEYFDLSTLQLGSSSHPYTAKIGGEGTPELVWTFKNIMLPDSSSNEPGSHGFVKFKVKLLKDLPRGTVVKNQAGIYFDFNSPVITNEVFNTIGLPPMVPVPLVVQNCNQTLAIDAGPDKEMMVCDESIIHLSKPVSGGVGTWRTIEGNGQLDLSGQDLVISSLAAGENLFRYKIIHCSAQDSMTLTVKRLITPATPVVSDLYTICSYDLPYAITVAGNNLTWYRDPGLNQELLKGNSFQPETSTVVYVTDQNEGCQTQASVVKILINPSPEPPVSGIADGCVNSEIALTVNSANPQWYTGQLDTSPSYTGNMIFPVFRSTGEHILYVSSKVNGCESERLPYTVTVKGFSLADMFIQNVVTPNEDGKNDNFYLRESNFDNCAGNFRQVIVYDRNGKTLFSSKNSDFIWNADVPDGVYFYSIAFDVQEFSGSIGVHRN